MPLVLTQNAETAEGHVYEDRLGTQYEFPRRYLRLIGVGERFVYYRGRRGVPKDEVPNAYIGAGVIGPIVPNADGGLLLAEILDFVPFAAPVPFKRDGRYLEDVPDRGGSATGVYFRGTSVRPISEEVFGRILDLAAVMVEESEGAPARPGGRYPSAERAQAIDEAGMPIALELARARWADAAVTPMPQSNPGFDLLVECDRSLWYVEVKSTSSLVPGFFMSESERLFATANADRYSLLVITGVRPEDGTSVTHYWHDGAVGGSGVELQARQWRGILTPSGLVPLLAPSGPPTGVGRRT
jgi:hypothetical protein